MATSFRTWLLLAAGVGSVALHGLVLGGFEASGRKEVAHSARPMLVRTLAIGAAQPLLETGPASSEGAAEAFSKAAASTVAAKPTRIADSEASAMRVDRSPTVVREPRSATRVAAKAAAAAPAAPPESPKGQYLLPSVLDRGPVPLSEIEFVFPAEAGQQEGYVLLQLLISEEGVVDDIQVIRSAPPGVFDHAAIAAFRNARFSPALRLGSPSGSQLRVQVDFTPFDRGGTVSGRRY